MKYWSLPELEEVTKDIKSTQAKLEREREAEAYNTLDDTLEILHKLHPPPPN